MWISPNWLAGGFWGSRWYASQPLTTSHPAYTVQFEGNQRYLRGVNGPIRFLVRRWDKSLVSVPLSASVALTFPDGTQTILSLVIEQVATAIQQAVATHYTFVHTGYYKLQVVVTLGDGTVVSTPRPVLVFVT